MSDANKAVFLSYASQDAEAAKRICDALRAAGVEVWFDQSELVGGDAWDQKIRKQIKDCALLIPIISANTQARTEGYFRLEWRLADQRTHHMAKGRPFLLPVVIDATTDADAAVPDSFTEVQWTRLRPGFGGQARPEDADPALAAFVARVQKLLGGSAGRPALAEASADTKNPPAKTRYRWLFPASIVVFALAAAAGWWGLRDRGQAGQASPGASGLEAIRARIIPDRWHQGDFEAVDSLLAAELQRDPNRAEAWALRSIGYSLQTLRLVDRGTGPLEQGRRAADRALALAPDLPLAQLALGYHLAANISRGGNPQAARAPVDRALARLSPDPITRFAGLAVVWGAYDLPETERRGQAWLKDEPDASYPAWILAAAASIARRPAEALARAERVTEDPNITGVRVFSTLFDIHYYLRADPAAAAKSLERVPLRGYSVPRIVFCRWLLASTQGAHDEALQSLTALPEPFISDVAYAGPKALLAGLSHRWAGRAEAAAVQFREAERHLREKLATDSENEEFRIGLAIALVGLGRAAEARNELALVDPVLKGRRPSLYRGHQYTALAQAYGMLGDAPTAAFYLRRLLSEPSNPPHTPASLLTDPRFSGLVAAPEITALLQEFARLDPVGAGTVPIRPLNPLVLQGREMLEKFVTDDTQSAALSLAEELAKRALQENPADADAWSLAAQISSSFYVSGRDHFPARRAAINSAAERAMQLAPQSDESLYARAVAYRLEATTKDEAERLLRELVRRQPGDRRMLRMLGNVVRNRQAYAEALAIYRQATSLPGGDARAELACAEMFDQLGRREEAAAATDRSLAVQPTGAAYLFKVNLARVRGDLAAARAELAKVPPAVLLDVRGASVAANVWLWSREPEKMIAVLNAIPGDDLYNSYFYGPKSLLLGFAHQIAGRNEVAKLQWRIALRNLEQRAEADPFVAMEPLFMGLRMFLGFLIGDPAMKAEARQMLRLYLQLGAPVEIDPTWDMTKLFSLLGMQDTIIDFCEEMLRSGDWPGLREIMRTRRDFAPLRGNPRFDALLVEPKK